MSPSSTSPEKVHVAQVGDQRAQSSMDADPGPLEKGSMMPEVTWTPEEEHAALKKLDWNLIPL